jgi:hypothetical protein
MPDRLTRNALNADEADLAFIAIVKLDRGVLWGKLKGN